MRSFSRFLILKITQITHTGHKELAALFGSPIAYIFLGLFVLSSLFIVFWLERFFIRNLADIRPLFDWMPVILIFFTAALTMRMWSEERSKNTLELLLTTPTALWVIMLGKLYACKVVIVLALLLTLVLPVMLSFVAEIDWGVIAASYIASIFIAMAYCAVGLFISAISKNQIIALLLSSMVLLGFYLVGQPFFYELFDSVFWAGVFKTLSPATYFESVSRGVISIRGLYYYIFVIGLFLVLNAWVLRRLSYANGHGFRQRSTALLVLLVVNLLLPNVWLNLWGGVRLDVTQARLFSLSDMTTNYLLNLEQPVRVRGFFSQKTHPLVSPLVAQLKDLLEEYQARSDGLLSVEILDPTADQALAASIQKKFQIQPLPLKVNRRYEASIVNAYFNLVIEYGDTHRVLGFEDLVKVGVIQTDQISLSLSNPEYEITKSIKGVVDDFELSDDLFRALKKQLRVDFYVSDDLLLPETVKAFKPELLAWLAAKKVDHKGQFNYQVHRVKSDRQSILALEKQGVVPLSLGLFQQPFYFNVSIRFGDALKQLALPDILSVEDFERRFNETFKQLRYNLSAKVAFYAPEGDQISRMLYTFLQNTYDADLNQLNLGGIINNFDVLVVYRPNNLSAIQLLALDQFVMQGGRVVMIGSNNLVAYENNEFVQKTIKTGVEDWLDFYGIHLSNSFIKDPSHINFPMRLGLAPDATSKPYQLVPYPYLIDLKGGMVNTQHMIGANMTNLMIPWASPIEVTQVFPGVKITPLLMPSKQAWQVDPKTPLYPSSLRDTSFYKPSSQKAINPLAVLVEGDMPSYFATHTPPNVSTQTGFFSVLKKSLTPAKMVLVNTSNLFDPTLLSILNSVGMSFYIESQFNLLTNMIEYLAGDTDLLNIRYKNYEPRLLPSLTENQRALIEYSAYIVSMILLIGMGIFYFLLNHLWRKKYLNTIQSF